MESGDDVASGKGVLVPVSATSDAFQRSVLAPLKSAYLYEESKQSFTYKSAVLINNPALEKKYDAFRAKRREAGYSEEELKESYGFLLFDDAGKANALGDTGVLTGNSTCTTLGDPSNGVYISMYSDCLDLNRWYHGKSGYIAIIRLTKGRVKKVLENYTQNFTAPTEGFDCHVSEQLPSVSAKTSSFLAFERTQYYMYELLDGGSNETARCPSAACPFAIVSFSYTDTKATLVAPQEKSEEKKLFCHYFPWRGQLQIGTHFYDVGLRSTAGALIPAELPPVVKVDRAISMLDLRQLLPRAVFETCFSGEVFLDGLYCSLYELVSSKAEETSSLSLLLREIKEKDVALIIPLNDGGFLILLHSSHFLTYDDTGSSATGVFQCMFVFPDSRVIYRGTKLGQRHPAMSSEILRVLPVLSYAEGEVEKTSIDPSEELCEVFVQHMQSYAALINPGLASSPSRDVTIFADQYDVPDAHKHLYSSPEWTNRAWQNFRSYLSKPVSFQLPLSKASEILAVGQEERIEDLDDDVYFCLSSPEEAPANHVGTGSEDQLAGQKSAVNVETSVDSCLTGAEAQVDLADVSHNVVPDDFKAEDATKDTDKSLIKVDDMGTKSPSTADELPAALIVSITSAERTVTSTESATKHIDFQLSGFSADKLQMSGVNSLNDETVQIKKGFDCPEVTNLITTKRRKKRRGRYRSRRYVSKARVETPSLQMVKIPVKDDMLKSQKEDQAKEDDKLKGQKEDQAIEGDNLKGQKEDQAEEEDNLKGQKEDQAEEEDNLKGQKEDEAKESGPQTSNPLNTDWRKVRRRKHTFGKLSSKNKKARSAPVGLTVAEEKKSDHGQQSVESTILMELEAFPLRKKMERWDLKPVISECGRILVPHGSADIANRIKTLKDKLQSTKDEPCLEKLLVDASVNALDTVKMEQEPSTATRTAVDRTEATTSNPGGNHFQDAIVSHINPEHSILRQSGDSNGLLTLNLERSEHSSTNDGTDNPPLETVQEKHADTPSTGRSASKGGFLLSKLKSVLLRGKRKTSVLVPEERTADIVQDTEPCPKKGKVDPDSEMLKSNDAITSVKDTTLAVKEVSKMLSVDPLFAYALGLTPKETPNKLQKSEGQDAQQRKDSSETQEQTILNKQPKIIQRPLSIFPRRDRIKTLKKHQGISAECVRKKWWLHFQTPACFASEKLKECTRDNSVRKTVKEKSNSACSSTDALNLLADLALGASKNQVPPQPAPALEREPETSLKKCDLTKEVTGGEHKSVLHALLRQPAARPSHLLVSPSPSHFVGGSELVELVSKEHAYSLPPSSSLLLGLSGTPFQVSPLSGSTRLLHHHQTMYGDGIKTLHSSIDLEDRGERNHRTPECLKKQMARRRKFRHSRTFVNKDASVQVTKEWKEDYDFNLDSKFTSDSKHRTIIRALHGPWDLSIQDTSEELQLIFHMWIGLFYSRSTARFFHIDSNCADPCSEESDSLKTSSGTVSPPSQSELKAKSSTPLANATDTSDTLSSKALDLSKKENSALDQGSVVLDLSLRNSNAEIVTSDPQVNKKETSVAGKQKESSETLNTLKSPVGLQNESTIQYFRTSVPSEIINKVNDVRSTYESKRTSTPLQSVDCLEHADVPSFKGGGTFISIREMLESVSVRPSNYQTASGIGRVLRGYNSEKTYLKRGLGNSEAPGSLVQKQERGSSKSVRDKGMDLNEKAGDVVHTTVQDEIKSKDGENWAVKEKPYQEGKIELSPKIIHPGDDSANDGRVCNQNLLENENEKKLSREEPKAASPGKAENGNENVDCCTEHEDELIKDDHVGKEDRLDEKECRVSDVEADSNLNNQPLPMMCDGPDLVKKDCITECSHQTPLDEQPPQADTKEDVCHDLQLNQWCANGSALTHEDAMSEKAPHSPSEVEPFHSEPAVEEHSENDICLAKLNDQLVSDGPDSIKKDCITECSRQTPLDEQLPQSDTKEDVCHDLQLGKLCANGSALTHEDAMSEKASHAPSEVEPFHNEPAVEEISENNICLSDEAHFQKVALPMSDKSSFSINRSIVDGSIPQTNDVKSQNKVMANFSLSSNDHEDQDTKLFEGEQKVVHTTQKELFCHEPHSPQCKAVTKCEAGVALTKETDLKTEKTNEEFEEIPGRVIIPFIGIDTSGEHPIQSYDSYSKGKIEIPFISDATYPETVLTTEICNTYAAQMYIKKAQLSAGKTSLSLLDVSETNQPVSGSESEDRCPTPTMDEKPYQCVTRSGPSSCSSSAINVSETLKKTQRWLSRSSAFIKNAMPLEQKHRSTVNSDPNPHHGLHPDLEQRTLRVLQSVDMFLSKRSHADKSSHIKTAEMKHSLDQTINTNSKYIPTCLALSHTSANFKNKGISSTNPAVASASTSQEVLSVRLQLNKTDSSIHQRYLKNTAKLQETSVSPELRSYTQRPVMAVKPSKSDEIQADCISKDRETENPVSYNLSKKKQTKTHIVSYTTPASMLLEKPTESLKGNSARLNDDKQEASELSSKSSWLSDVSDSKPNSEEAKFTFLDSLCWYEGRDTSKFTKSPSSLPMQSFEYAKMLSELDDGKRSFLTNSLVEKVGQTAKEGIKMIQKDFSEASTSVVDYKEDILDDSLLLGPHCSLTCTVYNTSQKVSKSFLEQLSQRCLQHDLTQASMEQECLIFSEQMKQLLKRSKRGPVNQEGAHDKSSLPCSSPVTVHFSSLEEQEDSVDHLDAPSLFRQKIKVDMSDRKDTTEEENTVPSPEFSQGTGNPVEHAGVSGVTAECARLYTAMMNDVCAVPSRPKHLRMDSGYLKTEPSNLFDFCDQMKREVDESFRSNLNSVVKKSCKAKNRFYILVTSDDAFFEETKAQLEAEGHTAVQPSEFFPGEDTSSSLLIILRNEDIAEHICEVPQLLELKKSPGVQFAGIDEPDDVVNLTYQELFLRGGFIMFDRAALESLSLCNMKKMSEMLQELSRTGKWKWMLHYRDSRRLKENARLSAEAKEKKYFLNWCQEVGILEVLTYHECDLTSKEQPDYLTCLVRLQVQNITARYTVFVTDAATDSTFATNGILTMTLNSFLTSSLSETLSLT